MRLIISAHKTITCLGYSIEDFWEGINSNNGTDPRDIKLPLDLPNNLNSRETRRLDRLSKISLSISKLIMEDYLNNRKEFNETRIGTVFNSGFGHLNSNLMFKEQIVSGEIEMASPALFTSTVHNAGLGKTCLNLKLKGVSTMLLGSNAIAYSCELLKSNKADAILCCGLEEYVQDLHDSIKEEKFIDHSNEALCRPLDINRKGTRLTEGAGALLIEKRDDDQSSSEHEVEILGYASGISYEYPVKDSSKIEYDIFAEVMRAAIKHANLHTDQIDAVILAAGGGKYSDFAEAKAVHQIFGKRTSAIPVTSIKGAIGETIGASLILNTIAASIALKKGELPLTSGCLEPDPALNLDIVHKKSRADNFRSILVNGFDTSGGIFSVVLGK